MLVHTRLVIAGVASADGAGWAVARRALLLGAHVTLVAPPALLPSCRALAERLGRGAHAVCADLDRAEDVAALHEHLRCAYGTVDGAVYAAAAGGAGAGAFAALARAVAPLLPAGGGSLVALAPHADPGRPSALEDAARQLARDLAAAGGRANVVVAGPRGRARAAGAACFLLSPLAQGTTGQVLHVGGRGRAGAAATAGPATTGRRTSDRRGGPPARAVVRGIGAGRALADTASTPPALPAAPATTDRKRD